MQESQAIYPKLTELNSQQTYRWVLWLATKCKQDNITEFSLDKIQPHWLDTKAQKLVYFLFLTIIAGLIVGLLYGVSTGWIGATIGGVTYGLVLASEKEIYPVRKLVFSAEFAKLNLPRAMLEALWWGVIYGLIDAVICYLIGGIPELIIGMVQVIIWGIVEGLIWGSLIPTFNKETNIYQSLQESAINAVIFTVIGGLAWLILYIIWLWVARQPWQPQSILLDTIVNGLFFGIYMGGFTCLQHFVLRLILVTNRVMPWNYANFLNHATTLGFLQLEDGHYRFKDDLLESLDGEKRGELPYSQ